MDKSILVISGGGINGFCILGVLKKLTELKMLENIETYCGTSVGAIICFLLLIGYTTTEIFELLVEIDFSLVFQYNIDELFNDVHLGLMSQEPTIYIIGTLMKRKNCSVKITFKELFNKYNKKIIITGVCLNDCKLHYFNNELTPDMKILDALRITMSIPILFKPVKYKNQIFVDGALGNNYPIDYFKEEDLEKIIGINITNSYEYNNIFNDQIEYFLQIFKCMIKNMMKINNELYDKYTINIKYQNINDWNIDNEQKIELFNIGYNTTIDIK